MTSVDIENINDYVINLLDEMLEQDMDIEQIRNEWYLKEVQEKLKELVMNIAQKMIPKEKKEKSPKDPNKPKRGKSAYILFCAEERENVKNQLPTNTKPTEITRELGSRWKALSASSKKKDIARVEKLKADAAKDKERYNNEMEDYQPPSEDELILAKKEKKKKSSGSKKDPNEPKRPCSAYIFYCSQMREEIKNEMEKAGEDTKGTNVTKKLGEAWKVLSSEDSPNKELYEFFLDKAKADKERYEKEMEIYKSGEEVSDKSTKKEKEKKKDTGKKTSDKKKKETGKKTSDKAKKETGYGVFCKANREHIKENYPEMSALNITKELSKMWKNLNEKDKDAWKNAALHQDEEVGEEVGEEEVGEEEVEEEVEEEEVEEEVEEEE